MPGLLMLAGWIKLMLRTPYSRLVSRVTHATAQRANQTAFRLTGLNASTSIVWTTPCLTQHYRGDWPVGGAYVSALAIGFSIQT